LLEEKNMAILKIFYPNFGVFLKKKKKKKGTFNRLYLYFWEKKVPNGENSPPKNKFHRQLAIASCLGGFYLDTQQQCAVLACCSNKMNIDDKYGLCNLNAKINFYC
jgi:hypothetical protein